MSRRVITLRSQESFLFTSPSANLVKWQKNCLSLYLSLSLQVILCLHGEPFWSQSFHRIIPLLTSRGYRVVVPDFVGFGRSDKYVDWRAYTVELHKETLTQVARQLGLDKAGRGHHKE